MPPRSVLFLCATSLTLAQSNPGPFTADQAERGAKSYAGACAACHGTDLVSGGAPPLAGTSFLEKWGTRPANALLMAVRQMPPRAAGSLPAETYRDVTAWLLEQNGHTPGTVPLAEMSKSAVAARVAPVADGRPRPLRAPAEFIAGLKSALPAPEGAGPTQQELNAAYASKADWLYHTHDYTGSRYVPSTEITPANAARLRVACVFQLGEQSNFQAGPLVYSGRMYVTGVRTTVALDATDCSLLWKYEWSPRAREVWPHNRGVALKDGYLVRATSDGYLLALNAANGQLIWARRAADTGIGETFTMAPLIFEDKILDRAGGQ